VGPTNWLKNRLSCYQRGCHCRECEINEADLRQGTYDNARGSLSEMGKQETRGIQGGSGLAMCQITLARRKSAAVFALIIHPRRTPKVFFRSPGDKICVKSDVKPENRLDVLPDRSVTWWPVTP